MVSPASPPIQVTIQRSPNSAPARGPAVTTIESRQMDVALPSTVQRPIGELERKTAKLAFRQALELLAAERVDEAKSMIMLGSKALSRRLPDDLTVERFSSMRKRVSVSNRGDRFVLSDEDTVLAFDAVVGVSLGLRAHAFGRQAERAEISPGGTYVVAPTVDYLTVYGVPGLVERAQVPVRSQAPFAFLDDTHVITVRLGAPSESAATVAADSQNYVVRELQNLKRPKSPATAEASVLRTTSVALPAGATEQSDDELVVIDLSTGKLDKTFKLTTPPDQGLLRRVASLPQGDLCGQSVDCERFAFNPTPIGRRVESLKVQAGVVAASWRGGSVSIHRLRDGKLLGSFRPRGEHWKPALVAVVNDPPRAAIATSLPEMGRGNEPPFSVTALVNLDKGQVVELIDDCRWATAVAFSKDGRSLMVGDLRKACLHDALTGKLRETTEEVRLARGAGDELEDVDVRPVQSGRWLLRTADGAFGVFDERDGKAVLRGQFQGDLGGYVASDERTVYLSDYSNKSAELVALGDQGIARRLLGTEELDEVLFPPEAANTKEGRLAAALAAIAQQSCVLEGFRLPSELCARPLPAQKSLR